MSRGTEDEGWGAGSGWALFPCVAGGRPLVLELNQSEAI
jgi:hypothetical protein